MDACMNCGQCSLHCSVEPINRVLGNLDILPSHKLGSLKKYVRKGLATDSELSDFNEGSFICTECYRCTQICPAGINLQDLWLTSKNDLALSRTCNPSGNLLPQPVLGRVLWIMPAVRRPFRPVFSAGPAPMCARWSPIISRTPKSWVTWMLRPSR